MEKGLMELVAVGGALIGGAGTAGFVVWKYLAPAVRGFISRLDPAVKEITGEKEEDPGIRSLVSATNSQVKAVAKLAEVAVDQGTAIQRQVHAMSQRLEHRMDDQDRDTQRQFGEVHGLLRAYGKRLTKVEKNQRRDWRRTTEGATGPGPTSSAVDARRDSPQTPPPGVILPEDDEPEGQG